jgi:hypothetical protein
MHSAATSAGNRPSVRQTFKLVDPETGQMLIVCIEKVSGIKAVDELQARIEALEEKAS